LGGVALSDIAAIDLDTWLRRQLDYLPSVMARLVWFASLRNPHNGRYTHPNLSERYAAAMVHAVLDVGHQHAFADWLGFTLEQQLADLKLCLAELASPPSDVAATWYRLESYHQFVPERALMVERLLFRCDLKALLEILVSPHALADRPTDRSELSSRRLLVTLSRRELEVLALIGSGQTTKEIATVLSLSCHTVSDHRRNICHKLGVHSTAELVALGLSLQHLSV